MLKNKFLKFDINYCLILFFDQKILSWQEQYKVISDTKIYNNNPFLVSFKLICIMKRLLFISVIVILFAGVVSSQESKVNQRIPLIGSEAPSFVANSTTGVVNFPADFGSDWKILFSHPRDFTPVCSSELLELAYHQSEFENLGAKLIVVSTDKVDRHEQWKAALEELHYKDRQPVSIDFPLVEDHQYRIINSYGMLDSERNVGQSIRGVFFIDPQNKVRAFYFYPNEVGRNIDEIKRTLIALQTNHNDKRVLLPANWNVGDDIMLPFLTDTERANLDNLDSEIYNLTWFMTYKKSNK
jgi:peroxiredoxin 2/4